MGRTKRGSNVLEKANKRLSGIKAFNNGLDLGGGLSVAAYNDKVNQLNKRIDDYNIALTAADAIGNEVTNMEKDLSTFSTRMLAGIGARFGKDSQEYEMAGGVRTSEIKRTAGKPKLKDNK